jgi:hypothetical protein
MSLLGGLGRSGFVGGGAIFSVVALVRHEKSERRVTELTWGSLGTRTRTSAVRFIAKSHGS